jgi:hypothetical protein
MVEIQEGKFYRTEAGDVIGPMHKTGGMFHTEMLPGFSFRADGFILTGPKKVRSGKRLVEVVCGDELYDEVLTSFGPLPSAIEADDGPLEVREGKYYVNGLGALIGPMAYLETTQDLRSTYFFENDELERTYDDNGFAHTTESVDDLVRELSDEEVEKLRAAAEVGIPTSKADILQEAIGTVAQRGEAYDGVEDNFVRIARYWNAHLINRFGAEVVEKCELNPLDVAQMMILMKQARIDFKQDHHDSWVDTCGYGGCGGELAAAERGE